MLTFFLALALLIGGYMLYGRFVEKCFGIDDAPPPALTKADGVDYVAMPTWKVFLIQLLNIAGTGPIFGALMGAVFGPIVFLWIVFGCILGGAVHDYLTGMISVKRGGETIVQTTGAYMGKIVLWVMRVFSVVLLVLVGTVFITSPAALVHMLTSFDEPLWVWIAVFVAYYFIATIFPVDKIVGRLYPFFGIVLVLMAVLVGVGLFFHGHPLPELTLLNQHPRLPAWPFMCITVACGAVSGFHATQSPIMARCLKTQKDGRRVFYGAMICEGIIALVWAAAGTAFYENSGALQKALATVGQSAVVYDISTGLLGTAGAILAVIGVIVCPISSGDTAFRSARLIIAEWFKVDQKNASKRLMIAVPLLTIGAILTQLNFNILWRYFAWSNQTLAMLSLWVGATYLFRRAKKRISCLIAVIPATFMSAVTSTYILMAPEGFKLSMDVAYPAGIAFAAVCLGLFTMSCKRRGQNAETDATRSENAA